MDKKRRENTSVKDKQNLCTLYSISQLVTTQEQCGIVSKNFKFIDEYGIGHLTSHRFDGLYISICDVLLKKDLVIDGHLPDSFLELSFLIEGELIIKIDGVNDDLVYESQECYLVHLKNIHGSISYYKRKRLKEIKIRMSFEFIQRHRLNEEFDILNRYSLLKFQNSFLHPLCSKKQEILAEILSDRRKGLLKRLFLESKILELIALQLETVTAVKPKKTAQVDNLVKKLYQVQHLIASDLSIQYSIQQLSKQIGLNDFVLKKEFKRIFDKTIFEYAIELRMDKAKQLLLHSNKPIYEISELVGYKNATHFTAAFKKIEGMTPKGYRNSNAS
ncbi:AraC family transcriptional regulator [Aquimarina sp. AU474]|uniref:helix-turn-helix domain-containing protein n=1 Tax=Aquimarina sp. AU474 TaxID=2108529 RepID=UPI001F3F11BE|nr:AraC family transcriptional regulator [Aquimarina sp. AU474]